MWFTQRGWNFGRWRTNLKLCCFAAQHLCFSSISFTWEPVRDIDFSAAPQSSWIIKLPFNKIPMAKGASQVAIVVKNPPANAGDAGSMPGSGRSLDGGNGNPLQYSCLENSMDRRAWWAPWGRKESDMTERQSTRTPWLRNQHWWITIN